MKKWFKPVELLYWLSCIATFWITAIMYPFNVYLKEDNVPFLSFTRLLILAGILLALGSVMYLILAAVGAIGKHIGLKKNLIVFFLYHFLLCAGFSIGVDLLFTFVTFSPYWIYLLLGFIPATLCSIIYSYDVSHHRNDATK